MAILKTKSLLERKSDDPEYRKRREEQYAIFKLEAQILYALEQKGWSYSQLAVATHTSKSNISRDLKGGGLLNATLSRLTRMADTLGMRLITLLVPKEQAHFILPKIEGLIRQSFNAAFGTQEIKSKIFSAAAPYEYKTANPGYLTLQEQPRQTTLIVMRDT